MERTTHQYSSLKEKAVLALCSYASLAIAFLLLLFIISTLEFIYSGSLHGFSQAPLNAFVLAWFNDFLFWLYSNFYFTPAYLLLFLIRPQLGRMVFLVLYSGLGFAHLLLTAYFSSTSVPLGSDLFGYSKEDIAQTLGASGVVSILNISLLTLAATSLVLLLIWLPKKLQINRYVAYSLFLAALLGLFSGFTQTPYRSGFKSDFTNNLVLNKSNFFYTEAFQHFLPEETEADIYAEGYLGIYTNNTVASKTPLIRYIDEQNYPFLRADSSADVLSPFFNKSAAPPHVVIILVEGLGRAFSNEGAYLRSFTPFLDSLSGKGLYFSNFLSAGGRTFAVLPSLLASLPYAEKGFLDLGNQMPDHLSLLSLLKSSGYHTSFYYGGDSRFDNMDIFLKKNAIDELNDGKTFPAGYQKLPSLNGFTWGYGDKELYRRYFDTRKADAPWPQLSVLLTVSSHSPFLLNEQARYQNMFRTRLAQLGIKGDEAKKYQSYGSHYASILYADDALRTFFDRYSKRTDYKNTIFLITGDHRMPEIPMSTRIDRYHVPLILYSPLLKRTAKIESVSSHLDIAPSLLAFLQRQYGIKRPAFCTWVGEGLDTSRAYRNIHNIPLIQTKTKISDFITGDHHSSSDALYQLSAGMSEEKTEDKVAAARLSASFESYKLRNERFLKTGKLLPDTIYQKYYPSGGKLSAH